MIRVPAIREGMTTSRLCVGHLDSDRLSEPSFPRRDNQIFPTMYSPEIEVREGNVPDKSYFCLFWLNSEWNDTEREQVVRDL